MPVDIEHFIRLRLSLPHDIICKHRRIRVSGVLSPAAVFLRASGLTHLLRERRRVEIQVVNGTTAIRLTPQQPVHAGHCGMKNDPETFGDLLQTLSEHVFFGPALQKNPRAGEGFSKGITGPTAPRTLCLSTSEFIQDEHFRSEVADATPVLRVQTATGPQTGTTRSLRGRPLSRTFL